MLSFTQHTDRVDFMAQERQVKKARVSRTWFSHIPRSRFLVPPFLPVPVPSRFHVVLISFSSAVFRCCCPSHVAVALPLRYRSSFAARRCSRSSPCCSQLPSSVAVALCPLLLRLRVPHCRCPLSLHCRCVAVEFPLPLRCRPSRGRCIAIALPLRSRRRCLLVWFGLVWLRSVGLL